MNKKGYKTMIIPLLSYLRLWLNNFWCSYGFRFFVKTDIFVQCCQQSRVQIIDKILQAVVLVITLDARQVWVESKLGNVEQIWQNVSQQICLRLLLKLWNNW